MLYENIIYEQIGKVASILREENIAYIANIEIVLTDNKYLLHVVYIKKTYMWWSGCKPSIFFSTCQNASFPIL